MSTLKDVVRFIFDCLAGLHTIAKKKASSLKQSTKDYLIGLLAKDVVKNKPTFLTDEAFKKELHRILHNDAELMKKLAKL
jgi:hypothetical protein